MKSSEIPRGGIDRRQAKWGNRHAQKGVSAVEFLLVSPFALLVVMALIQLGLMFSAKQILNEATFVAARAGAVQNARKVPMQAALAKALIPFYQDTTTTDDYSRMSYALNSAQSDVSNPARVDLTILNPNGDVFSDFGLADSNNQIYIPNDSLDYRDHNVRGSTSHLSIQDANVLKIRVTYAYELKVPLMKAVFASVMCGIDSGVEAFGRGGGASGGVASASDCSQYYQQGRVPIVSYATVQMQTPAWQS